MIHPLSRTNLHRVASLGIVLAVAASLGAGFVAAQDDRSFAVEQGDRCTEVEPLGDGERSVEAFYGYTLDEGPNVDQYSANTPDGIEDRNGNISSLFLYRGTEGLSLVVIHDDPAPGATGGGAATFRFQALPETGDWVVRDDPSNASAEVWNASDARGALVHWSWRPNYTDGGAFRGGLDGEFAVGIDPAFNDDAALDPLDPGTIAAWRVLSGDAASPDEIALDTNASVTIRTGTCD